MRRMCPLRGTTCGHVCNAYCRDGEHCGVQYSSIADLDEYRAFTARRQPRMVRVERATEAPPLEERPDRERFIQRSGVPGGAAPYAYLRWFAGCPVPCPYQKEEESCAGSGMRTD